MKKLHYLIIHCTDTPQGRKISAQDIRRWHIVERGWSKVGYSDMVHIDGSLENLTPFDQDAQVDPFEVTNGVLGMNGVSRHVVYVGGQKEGKPYDTRTEEQYYALETYVKYMILRHPNIKIAGHHQFSKKKCPSFHVPEWLQSICIDEKNIYYEIR